VPKVEPYVPPGNYELPAVAGKSDGFIVLSSLGFLILFTERGLYAHLTEGQRSATVATIILALSAVVVFVGFLASFYLPGRLMPEHDQTRWIPHTLNFLVGQMVIAVTCMLVAGAIAIGLYVYLVYPTCWLSLGFYATAFFMWLWALSSIKALCCSCAILVFSIKQAGPTG